MKKHNFKSCEAIIGICEVRNSHSVRATLQRYMSWDDGLILKEIGILSYTYIPTALIRMPTYMYCIGIVFRMKYL